jgi:hypothetical protein
MGEPTGIGALVKVRSYCLYNKGTVMEAVESLMTTTR